MPTAEPPSPTVTPLPPPLVPPPDAAGISHTTPPLGIVSPQPHPTTPDSLWLASGSAGVSTIAITMHGGRPFVPVVADGVRRDFLLSNVRESAVDDLLPTMGNAGASFLRTLQIGDVRLTNVGVTHERLAPFSQTYLGFKAAGILGAELFSKYPVTIDYPNRTMTIYRTEEAATAARPTGAVTVPMEIVNAKPAVACTVDGKSVSPCFLDVYADADLALFGPHRVSFNDPLMPMRDAEPGVEMRGVVMRAHKLSIGTLDVTGPLVEMSPEGYAFASTAVLGSGVLSRFSITIDEIGGTFTIAGDLGAASTPSPVDGSGLWLVRRSDAITVRSVLRKSPAEAAGFAAGDVILALDGKPPQDLDAARTALMQPAGTKVLVTVERGTARHDVTLVLRPAI